MNDTTHDGAPSSKQASTLGFPGLALMVIGAGIAWGPGGILAALGLGAFLLALGGDIERAISNR